MFDPIGTVSITLGSVVLDRPDRTGRYFAKDLAGGWAYLVGDAEGDNRFRGHGVCEGGLDTTLRCAFLSAVNRIPDCGRIRILVDTRQAHRMIVQLARRDPHVVAAIAGRPVAVLTLPEERSSHQVRSAAERAASTALRDREHAEWHASEAEAEAEAAGGADRRTTARGPRLSIPRVARPGHKRAGHKRVERRNGAPCATGAHGGGPRACARRGAPAPLICVQREPHRWPLSQTPRSGGWSVPSWIVHATV